MTQKIVKTIYIVMELDKNDNVVKIGPVYKREDRAFSVCYLLASQNPDKVFRVERHEVL